MGANLSKLEGQEQLDGAHKELLREHGGLVEAHRNLKLQQQRLDEYLNTPHHERTQSFKIQVESRRQNVDRARGVIGVIEAAIAQIQHIIDKITNRRAVEIMLIRKITSPHAPTGMPAEIAAEIAAYNNGLQRPEGYYKPAPKYQGLIGAEAEWHS